MGKLRIDFTNSGLPSLFHQVHFHVFLSPQNQKTKLPLHRITPVQGQIKQIFGATLLAVLSITAQPLCREPSFPCSVTGAARQQILGAKPFSPCPPRTIMQTRFVPRSQHRGLSVTALCALLSLHWFKEFIPQPRAFVNTQGTIIFSVYSGFAVSGDAMLFLSSTNNFCTSSPTGASVLFSRQRFFR